MLTLTNPYTEQKEFELPRLPAADVDAVVQRARAAYLAWRCEPVSARAALCEKFLKAFEASGEQTACDITRHMGKPLRQARNEVAGTLERARYMISIAEPVLADEWLPDKPGFQRYIRHEPLGVVLDIAAWNYPLLIAVNVVVPAVLAGNAVIIKHSSKTPLCGQAFADAFCRAGAPEGLVQNVIADHDVTRVLIQHPGIDHVSFTGSVSGGHDVVRSAADRFIDVGLELGGKDPAYVCADANLDYAVANCVDGAFYNAGQSCCAVERVYIESSIYPAFVDAFAALTREYVLGDPLNGQTSIGPMASRNAPAFLAGQVEDALRRGGRLVVDPASFARPDTGWFAAPAVVADAPQDCSLMQEESFAP